MKPADTTLLSSLLDLDEAVLRAVRRLEGPALTRLMKGLTHFGDGASWTFAGLLLWASSPGGPHLALSLGLAAGLATLVTQGAKRAWRRPRPSTLVGFTALAENPDSFSFPSGHTAAAVAVAVALSGQGLGLGMVAFPLAGGIAVSRVYLGAHYPLDVACGAIIGLVAGLAVRTMVGM